MNEVVKDALTCDEYPRYISQSLADDVFKRRDEVDGVRDSSRRMYHQEERTELQKFGDDGWRHRFNALGERELKELDYFMMIICWISILQLKEKAMARRITCFTVTLTSTTTLTGSKIDLSSTMTATARAKTSFIYYVMCLGARFYDYLAPSEVKKKLSSKLVTITFAS